jgi:signal transduction histidine kinase
MAIGAKVWLYETDSAGNNLSLRGFREINGGSGYGSQNSTRVHFGVNQSGMFNIIVHFPTSGNKRIVKKASGGTYLRLSEEEGWHRNRILFASSLARFVRDPQTHWEGLKFSFLLIALIASYYWAGMKYKWRKRTRTLLIISISVFYWIQIWIFFYQGILLSFILPLISSVTVLFVIHLLYERIFLKRATAIEKERIRERIARDLHDDLASTIGSTAIYVESLKRSTRKANIGVKRTLDKIENLVSEAEDGVADLVWTVAPANDSLESLVARLRKMTSELCKINKVKYSVNTSGEFKGLTLPDEARKNIYLIFKEALHNAMKHSSASLIELSVRLQFGKLQLSLGDNGKGFAGVPSEDVEGQKGHGLRNMAQRAKDIGADFAVTSKPGIGTTIELSIKMT